MTARRTLTERTTFFKFIQLLCKQSLLVMTPEEKILPRNQSDSQSDLFSIWAILAWSDSQLKQFSSEVILNLREVFKKQNGNV